LVLKGKIEKQVIDTLFKSMGLLWYWLRSEWQARMAISCSRCIQNSRNDPAQSLKHVLGVLKRKAIGLIHSKEPTYPELDESIKWE
jgi:hypothetical protein